MERIVKILKLENERQLHCSLDGCLIREGDWFVLTPLEGYPVKFISGRMHAKHLASSDLLSMKTICNGEPNPSPTGVIVPSVNR